MREPGYGCAAVLLSVLAFANGIPAAGRTMPAGGPQPLAAASAIEALVDESVADGLNDAGAPGLVVAVVIGGEVVLVKGYGLANLERGTLMTATTNLRAGSVSKPVAAAAVLQLVSEGKLALDAPIDRYLPDLVEPDRFGPVSTVAQLLTMTGGYTDDVLRVHTLDEAELVPLGEMLRRRLGPREVQPGVMVYSSWNLALLGRAMESVTAGSFDDIVRRSLFEPLDMSRSSYSQPPPASLASNLATGYSLEDGGFRVVSNDLLLLAPGIGLVTTGEDMARFMAALMPTDEPTVLSREVLHGLLERQAGAHPLLRGRSYGFSETSFGPPGTLYHDGNGIGFCSRMVLLPERGMGIFVSANHRALDGRLNATPTFRFVQRLAVKLLAQLAPEEPVAAPRKDAIASAAGRVTRYEGQYQSAGAPRHNMLKVGMLLDVATVRAVGDGTLVIGRGCYREVEPGLFQNQEHPQVLALFRADGDGEPRYLTFGGTGTYERVPWHGRIGLHLGVVCVAAALGMVPPVLWVLRRRASALAALGGVTGLTFLVGFAVFMALGDLLELFRSMPLALGGVLLLPWIGAAITVALIADRGNRHGEPSRRLRTRRIAAGLAVATNLLVVAEVLYWRLFPW